MGEFVQPICPIGKDTPLSNKLVRDQLVTGAAQAVLLDPQGAPAIRAELDQGLRRYYHLAEDANPDRTSYLIHKYTRTAFQGALMHVAGDHLIGNTLSSLQGETSLIPSDLPTDPGFYMGVAIPHPYEDPYHTFLGAGVSYWRGAMDQSFHESAQPGHPYHPLLREFTSVYEEYRESAAKFEPERWSVEEARKSAQHSITVDGSGDNTLAVMNTLIAEDMATHSALSPGEMKKRALQTTNRASVLTRANREVTFRDAFKGLGRVFKEVDGELVFQNRSLEAGWKVPRACAGRLPLLSADPDNQMRARKFFRIAQEQAGIPFPEAKSGRFDSATVLYVVGANLAEGTLFADRPRKN